MAALPLFSRLSSRRSDSLSDTTPTERRLSDLSNKSLHTCYEPDQKAPGRWVTSFKSSLNPTIVGKKKARRNRVLVLIVLILALAGIAVLVWFSLVLTLIDRLTPTVPSNGLQRILKTWKVPADSVAALSPWPEDFSQGITPVQCHSHNDYWRSVPLYEAIAAGCTGVEADIWLEGSDLLVGHRKRSLSPDRTLKSLYIDLLTTILSNLNANSSTNSSVGIFDVDPTTSLTLLIDIKTDGNATWPVLLNQLAPLRSGGWLSHWNGTNKTLVRGPVTVVGTGNTLFDLVVAEEDRYVFFDAPLDELAQNSAYTSENSYYASVSMKKAVGVVWPWGPTDSQKQAMQKMISAASERGLLSRFWSIPSWPVSLRMRLWQFLVDSGVGMLNVDDVVEATRWNWDWCIVAGLVLC
ncbi:altered inheritance of mitochondria protein 6 [Aspergillus viridinutans]|uniref:Altered inheritance of mitochondria protein 6 n=1 Tax=Aspergillus viridinutans TaxID=75553 RepID=A0A9P3C054_ASPVI|nr:altered inheritance of mitochondria protein 6 [Aspergillus viridinutans]GIK02941.1 altered inheritance of mitochondria protein 6 [Aspergillus viridinutans]